MRVHTDPPLLHLDPADEGVHAIEDDPTFNESMYANVLDPASRLGVWMRVGNRPREGHSEVSCCVYLPDGRVAFVFSRPACDTNEAFAAGGASFEVLEPFHRVRMRYDGPLLLLDDPLALADPKAGELAHLGDPHEDLAWLCSRAWRFGGPGEAAGLAARRDLCAAYERAGGGAVDLTALHWWEVLGALKWGVVCQVQAARHRPDAPSLEHAAIGRRVTESELDLLVLLVLLEQAA